MSFTTNSLSLNCFICCTVFLTEVIDSLERGFKEKTNPDFLILEINSSRYAYNMTLSEVNFYVVKALLNLYPIKEADGNVLTAFNQIFAQLNGVLKNYIRGEQAMTDCLKAIEVSTIFGGLIYATNDETMEYFIKMLFFLFCWGFVVVFVTLLR